MIADKTRNQVIGHIDGDVARMGIDEDNMAHIMGILTNMYSDPEMAVLREYATNACDAHVEAGNTAPIEVQTPTSLSPYLKIRDYGVGLSVEDVHTMYSRYGASSKRDTNAQTGMLGIGSKSGLTYADQFTITSVKNGTKLVCVVSRDEDGGGSMTIPDTYATDEPNGTEVTIPVHRNHAFPDKAADLFRFWPKGSVLVNGKAPAHFADSDQVVKIADGLYFEKGYESQSYVIMGNVPYPHDFTDDIEGLGAYGRANGRILAFVPTGSCMFVPSREALHYTKRTNETLAKVVETYKSSVKASLQAACDAAASAFEALRIVIEWDQVPGAPPASEITYRGSQMPPGYDGTVLIHAPGARPPYWSRRNKAYAAENKGIPAIQFPGTLWIHGFVPQKFTAQHKAKIEQWIEDNLGEDHGVTQYAMLKGPTANPDPKWVDKSRVVAWQDIRKIKLDTVWVDRSGTPRRLTGSYDLVINGERRTEVPANDPVLQPKTGCVMIWMNTNVNNVYWNQTRALQKMHKDYVVVALAKNRIGKFRRDFPHFITYDEAVTKAAKKWLAGVTEAQKVALAIHDHEDRTTWGRGRVYEKLRALDPARLDDPELTAAVKAAKVDVGTVLEGRSTFRPYCKLDVPKFRNPLAKYPLYTVEHAKHDHTYLYLNAAYAAEKESA